LEADGTGAQRFVGPLALISGAIAAMVLAFSFSDSKVGRAPALPGKPDSPATVPGANATAPKAPATSNGQQALAPEKSFPPDYNFALASHGASAEGGRNPERLIDGDLHYTAGSGFASATVNPPQPFVIKLKEPVKLECIRFLLWNLSESRFYRYKLEVCFDDNPAHWATVSDNTGAEVECRGWQELRFDPRIVKQIRLTGTFNNINSFFHVVELEAYREAPTGRPVSTNASTPAEPKRVDDPEF
jgi:hypothetical protein